MDILPAGPALVALAGTITGDAMADAVDATELLDVDMDEFAWFLALIAEDGGLGVECTETAKPSAAQDEADGGDWTVQPLGNGGRRQALAAQCHDLTDLLVVKFVRTAMGPRRAINQSHGSFRGMTIAPLAHGLWCHTLRLRHRSNAPAAGEAPHHHHSTMPRRARIIMDVHPRPPGRGCRSGNHSLSAQPRRDNLFGSYI